MFTGIIEETAKVKEIKKDRNLAVIKLKVKKIYKGIKRGDSVCIDGACLTVSSKSGNSLSFEMMKETLNKTTLGHLDVGAKVNCERALKATGRLDGHLVLGHVDCVGKIIDIKQQKNYFEILISRNKEIASFIAEKGSVCIDGISLTIGKVTKTQFSVYIIPFTKKVTTIGEKKKGDAVNIEADVLARYILNKK